MRPGTRRGVLAAAGTASLLTGLIGARSGPGASVRTIGAAQGPPASPAPSPPAGASSQDRPPSSSSAHRSPPATAPPATEAPAYRDGVYSGPEVDVSYGYVEVRATISGGRLVDVAPLVMPGDRSRSAYLAQRSAPILRKEALAAQSAAIDAVSGATYTSEGYAESLQAALDEARR